MNDVGPVERSSFEIKRDLRLRRSELQDNLRQFFRGSKVRADDSNRPSGPVGGMGTIGRIGTGAAMPVLTVAAGAALVGLFLLRRRLLPLRLASRFVEVAAPVVLPVLVRRIAGRNPAS